MTEELYYTSDFALASTLLCLGFLLKKITDAKDPKQKARKFFHFSAISVEGANAHDIANSFYKNELLVEPMAFNSFQRNLKAKLLHLKREQLA